VEVLLWAKSIAAGAAGCLGSLRSKMTRGVDVAEFHANRRGVVPSSFRVTSNWLPE